MPRIEDERLALGERVGVSELRALDVARPEVHRRVLVAQHLARLVGAAISVRERHEVRNPREVEPWEPGPKIPTISLSRWIAVTPPAPPRRAIRRSERAQFYSGVDNQFLAASARVRMPPRGAFMVAVEGGPRARPTVRLHNHCLQREHDSATGGNHSVAL